MNLTNIDDKDNNHCPEEVWYQFFCIILWGGVVLLLLMRDNWVQSQINYINYILQWFLPLPPIILFHHNTILNFCFVMEVTTLQYLAMNQSPAHTGDNKVLSSCFISRFSHAFWQQVMLHVVVLSFPRVISAMLYAAQRYRHWFSIWCLCFLLRALPSMFETNCLYPECNCGTLSSNSTRFCSRL